MAYMECSHFTSITFAEWQHSIYLTILPSQATAALRPYQALTALDP